MPTAPTLPVTAARPCWLIAALTSAAVVIDIGITNESGELLAGEFCTRKLAETGSYIAVSEHHPLATQDRVRLSDLKS